MFGTSARGGIKILRRLLRYSDHIFRLRELIKEVGDKRQRCQIAMEGIFAAGLVMSLGQLGSLNALEQTQRPSYWRRWVGGKMASADTIGRGFGHADCDDIRNLIKHAYSRLKCNKALNSLRAGMIALVLDGHESHCSTQESTRFEMHQSCRASAPRSSVSGPCHDRSSQGSL